MSLRTKVLFKHYIVGGIRKMFIIPMVFNEFAGTVETAREIGTYVGVALVAIAFTCAYVTMDKKIYKSAMKSTRR
ncbi:hypothetical protein [Priestia taiwanensis]|nr:hypothetical protein [Priestia taiwanensis]MBM7364075.1 hypothetical protein [Priestia taiwanensis]